MPRSPSPNRTSPSHPGAQFRFERRHVDGRTSPVVPVCSRSCDPCRRRLGRDLNQRVDSGSDVCMRFLRTDCPRSSKGSGAGVCQHARASDSRSTSSSSASETHSSSSVAVFLIRHTRGAVPASDENSADLDRLPIGVERQRQRTFARVAARLRRGQQIDVADRRVVCIGETPRREIGHADAEPVAERGVRQREHDNAAGSSGWCGASGVPPDGR